MILAVEAQEWSERQSFGLDKEDAQAGKELWEIHEVANALVSVLFGNLPLIWRRTNDVVLPRRFASASGCFGFSNLVGRLHPGRREHLRRRGLGWTKLGLTKRGLAKLRLTKLGGAKLGGGVPHVGEQSEQGD